MTKIRSCIPLIVMSLAVNTYSVHAKDIVDSKSADRAIYAGIGFAPEDQPHHIEVGLNLGVAPVYEGADEYGANATPLLKLVKPGAYFINGATINPNDGVLNAGLSLIHFGSRNANKSGIRFLLGPYLRVHPGREEDVDDTLTGLGDIDTSAGLGLFLSAEVNQWNFILAAVPHDVDQNDDGLLTTLDIRYHALQSNKWRFTSGLAGSWGNDEYTQAYFGVDTNQSALSGYTLYDAKAGMKDIGVYLESSYFYTDNWVWHAQIGYWQLQGDAVNSPLVEVGSKSQTRALIALSYEF